MLQILQYHIWADFWLWTKHKLTLLIGREFFAGKFLLMQYRINHVMLWFVQHTRTMIISASRKERKNSCVLIDALPPTKNTHPHSNYSRYSVTKCREQSDHDHGWVLWSNILDIIFCWRMPGLRNFLHLPSSSCGILSTWPNSWAMVNAADRPLSWTMAHDDGRHIVPSSASPNVSHFIW